MPSTPLPPLPPLPPPADEGTIPRAIDDATPTWLDGRRAQFGMPEFLWREFQESYPPATLQALRHHPGFVEAAVISVWRRWRRRWLAGEWGAQVAQ